MVDRPGGDLLVRQANLPGVAGPRDVLVRDGHIVEVAVAIDAGRSHAPLGTDVLDGSGRLMLPGLVEAHCHLDKTLWGMPWVPHCASNTIEGRIAHERVERARHDLPSRQNMTALATAMVRHGTSYIRTHTNVDSGIGVRGVAAVMEVASDLAAQVTIEQVAFPQSGIIADPGTATLLEEAARLGVAAIGGLDPAGYDGDPIGHLDVVFGIADRYGCAVDIHLHDTGARGLWECELIAERTRVLGLQGRVAISHAFALGEVDGGERQSQVLATLADSGVGVVTSAPMDRAFPPLDRLRDLGVGVACGSDGIRDSWNPYGNGDMLERAMLLAMRSGYRRDDAIEAALSAATYGGAGLLQVPVYGLEPGCRADFLLVSAGTSAEAVVSRPASRTVVKRGRVVAA